MQRELLDIFGRRGPHAPPTPVPPPAAAELPVHIVVYGPDGIVAPTEARLVLDDGKCYEGVQAGPQVHWSLPAGSQYGWCARLLLKAAGLRDFNDRIELRPDINVSMQAVSVMLPPLERRGQFYYQDGQPFTVIMASAFRLYERMLNGEDVTPFLADLQDVGFNSARVWLLNTSVGHILPADHPDFYARLPALVDACYAHGLYPELTVFTQTQSLMPAVVQQQRHYDATIQALGSLFVFVEGVNENDSHDNAIDAGLRFWKADGITFDLCRGSNGSDAWAVEPVIDSTRYHSNDANEWWRRCAHNGMEMGDAFGKPNIANENTRPDHDGNSSHHFDAAAGAALLSAGSCFHSTSGKNATPLTGIDRVCAQAWTAGARSIDLSQRTMPYIRRDDLNVAGQVIRAYQRGTQIIRIRA